MERTTPPSIDQRDEFALIAALQGLLPREPGWVEVGRGDDDAAVLDLGGRDWFVWTCDTLVEGVHFRRDWLTARQLGRRAASVNLSDLAAMGAQPVAALVSLHLPASLPQRLYRDLMRGLGEQLHAFGASLVGGNLSRSAVWSIDVSLLGRAAGHRVARRRGARVGDRVLVTGHPGEAAAGLQILRRNRTASGTGKLLKRWIAPTPRVEAGKLLLQGGVTAMIDISDGLLADLAHLCDASDVGVRLDRRALPVSPALRRHASQRRRPPWHWILQGGEDYELLCTAPPRRASALQTRLRDTLGLPLTDVGAIVPRRDGLLLEDGDATRRFSRRGHRHFGEGDR